MSKAAHRKSARSYQLALYQKLCVGYKKTHHFEQAIELGKHHLVLAKQLKDPSAQIVSGRNLSNALLSKRTTMVVGARRPLDAWRIQVNLMDTQALALTRETVCASNGFNTEPRDSPNEPHARLPGGFPSAFQLGLRYRTHY